MATRNQTQTAKLLRCGFQTIQGILRWAVARGMALRFDAPPLHMSLDEKAIKKGHCYATILSDATQGTVLDLVEGRNITNVQDLLRRPFSKEKRKHIETITTDRWWPYISSAQELLPKVTLMHDRFHWIQYLNKAIHEVRRREVKKHAVLKNARFAILKNEGNRTEKQKEIFQRVQESNVEVRCVWKLKEDLNLFSNRLVGKRPHNTSNFGWVAFSGPAFKKSAR